MQATIVLLLLGLTLLDSAIAEEKQGEIAEITCGTSAGDIELEFKRSWSPNGYDRVVELFEKGTMRPQPLSYSSLSTSILT